MPALASTIFKIKAIADYISPSPHLLSFRKGQPFYALSADSERGVYFVSTQYATPFARTAVSGMVPIRYFQEVDLMSRDNGLPSQSTSQKTDRQRQSAVAQTTSKKNESNAANSDQMQIQSETQVAAKTAAYPQAHAKRSSPQAAIVPQSMAATVAEAHVSLPPAPAVPAKNATHFTSSTMDRVRDAAIPRSQPNSNHKQGFQISAEWATLLRFQPHVIFADVMSVRATGRTTGDEFRIKVIRGACSHVMIRSTTDLVELHRQIVCQCPTVSLPESPFSSSYQLLDPATKVQKLEIYLNTLISYPWRANGVSSSANEPNMPTVVSSFFHPQSEAEAAMLHQSHIRRDSGFDDTCQRKGLNQQGKIHEVCPWTIQREEQDVSSNLPLTASQLAKPTPAKSACSTTHATTKT
ncbi:hypothetical protein BDEG_23540 [Batrachochytrium dendrobatidis JEL423]|uniref:SH3 domain-containing protein n=1 Tax=Batrachochytrium dendrobatidis (strain JEL423) TaxID=403673 RepID=A0A177WK51_BATDL|nr:hypothetical protein BDEG_23540 [Batrachochytrium dendrobatidis JEL423]